MVLTRPRPPQMILGARVSRRQASRTTQGRALDDCPAAPSGCVGTWLPMRLRLLEPVAPQVIGAKQTYSRGGCGARDLIPRSAKRGHKRSGIRLRGSKAVAAEQRVGRTSSMYHPALAQSIGYWLIDSSCSCKRERCDYLACPQGAQQFSFHGHELI